MMGQGGTIGSRIRYLRKRRGLKQVELAQHLGISQGTLSEIERDKAKPTLEMVISLAQYFEVGISWLATGMKGDAECIPTDPDFKKRLKDAMLWSGLTSADLEKDLALDRGTLSSDSVGHACDAQFLINLARLTGVELEWLLSGNGKGPPESKEVKKVLDDFIQRLRKIVAAVFSEQAGKGTPSSTSQDEDYIELLADFYFLINAYPSHQATLSRRENFYRWLKTLLRED